MKKMIACSSGMPLLILILSGCGPIGGKNSSMSSIYGFTAILSLLMLIGYFAARKKKDVWFLLLFSSVFVVNFGYYCLAVSRTLNGALMANRVSYLGSVFLPLSMLLIILKITGISYKKWLPGALLVLGIFVFLVAASPGYLTIYYKEVSLEIINHTATLHKVYGPWHALYLFYLLGYFSAMVAVILYITIKKKMETMARAIIIAIAVFVNLIVWLIEQMVQIDFEILSISYIISECFLLGLNFFMWENEKLRETLQNNRPHASAKPHITSEDNPIDPTEIDQSLILRMELFQKGLSELTKTENIIFNHYINGRNTKQVMAALEIKENTLKFHNKNIYSKLEVSSRKQLLEMHKLIKAYETALDRSTHA